jgi:hypothetical protein
MASPDEQTPSPKPTQVEAEIQEDLLLYGGQTWGKNARWFMLSTIAHVLLLGVLATLTFTITQKRDEMIKVKTLPLSEEDQLKAKADKPDDNWEGEPSLKDLPGLLSMEQLTPKQAKTSTSPPPALGAPAPIRTASLPNPRQ